MLKAPRASPKHLDNIHLALDLAAKAERETHTLVFFIC